jgi:antitoxin component HigA of HigAB toxin-antitoxin module
MAEMRKLRVFLCHSKEDRQQARELYNRLIADGFDIWFDEEKLVPGQDWDLEILKALRETDVVVACLSNISVSKKGYVQKEIRIALDVADEQPEGAIFVIPTRLEDCQVPIRLSKWQWVDLFDETGYEKLKESLSFQARRLNIPDDELLIREWLAEIVCQKYKRPEDVADKIISHIGLYDEHFLTQARSFYLTEFFLKNRKSMLRYAMLVAVRLIATAHELTEQHKSPESIKKHLLEQGRNLFVAAAHPLWGYYPKDHVMGTAYYDVPERDLPMFDEDEGGLVFNPFLFEMTLGLGTLGEVDAAISLVDSAIEEISQGKVLSNYELIYIASVKIAEVLKASKQYYLAFLRISRAAVLYDRYPQQVKQALDMQYDFGEPELVLGIEVYKRIGLGIPSNEKFGEAMVYLVNTANELEEKGRSHIRGLTFDTIGTCYMDLAQYLGSRGGHEQALFATKLACNYHVYSHLSEELREIIRESVLAWFPTEYPTIKSVLDQHEEKIRSSSKSVAREGYEGEKKKMNANPDGINVAKQIFDRWNQALKSLPIEMNEQVGQAAQPLTKLVHSATFSLEISGVYSMEKAVTNMQKMMTEITRFSIICFLAGLESQYHESKRHSVNNGQISEEQFLNLQMQAAQPIAEYMIGLMKIFFQNMKALKELESKTSISTDQQYIAALTDAITDVSYQIFELGKKYFRETANIEKFRQSAL